MFHTLVCFYLLIAASYDSSYFSYFLCVVCVFLRLFSPHSVPRVCVRACFELDEFLRSMDKRVEFSTVMTCREKKTDVLLYSTVETTTQILRPACVMCLFTIFRACVVLVLSLFHSGVLCRRDRIHDNAAGLHAPQNQHRRIM